MFISGCRTRYLKNGEQRSDGHFLLLMELEGKPEAELRGLVIKGVTLKQSGNFMTAMWDAPTGDRINLSGAYGADGLFRVVSERLYRLGAILPLWLYEAWNKGNGWNDVGTEGPQMREWAEKEAPAFPFKKRAKKS